MFFGPKPVNGVKNPQAGTEYVESTRGCRENAMNYPSAASSGIEFSFFADHLPFLYIPEKALHQ
jgi:hypothetical protein